MGKKTRIVIRVFQLAMFSSKKKILRCAQNDNFTFRRVTEEKATEELSP
jgi:hypothetical protein